MRMTSEKELLSIHASSGISYIIQQRYATLSGSDCDVIGLGLRHDHVRILQIHAPILIEPSISLLSRVPVILTNASCSRHKLQIHSPRLAPCSRPVSTALTISLFSGRNGILQTNLGPGCCFAYAYAIRRLSRRIQRRR